MITITIGEPNKLTATHFSPKSGFVAFNYDANIVQYIKTMPTRVYLPDSKQWEIPMASISTLCNELSHYDVTITGEMLKEHEDGVNVLPEEFKFKTKPFDHQVEGVLYGLNHNTFLLGDEQGLGKTKQIIDLAGLRKNTEGLKHCLIICGVNGNKYNWQNEVSVHSDEKSWILGTRFTKRTNKEFVGSSQDKLDDLSNLPDCLFIITNIETLRQLSRKDKRKTIYPFADKINQLCDSGEIGMIAFDECHKAANPDSSQGKAMLSLKGKYKIAMTGTPLMNKPLDLYFPLRWLGYEDHSFYAFKNYYCIFDGFGNPNGYKNLGDLRSIVEQVMLRRLKDEVLDLPPKIHTVEYVDMYSDQKKVYEEVKSELRENIDKLKVGPNPLAQMIRLRQATGYPGILSTEIKESAKMDRMVELVEEITSSGGKCIIFSNWEQIASVVKQKLVAYRPAYIVGNVKTEDRFKEMDRFQHDNNCKVIIGTIGAMGTGFTLNAASDVIFLDSPWNRALKDQAEDRAHRIGTRGTVNVRTIVCKDTIDEKIENVVYKKGKLSDMLIDGNAEIKSKDSFIQYMLN